MASPDLSVHKINRGVVLLRACQGCVRFPATTTWRTLDVPVCLSKKEWKKDKWLCLWEREMLEFHGLKIQWATEGLMFFLNNNMNCHVQLKFLRFEKSSSFFCFHQIDHQPPYPHVFKCRAFSDVTKGNHCKVCPNDRRQVPSCLAFFD